MATNSRGSLGAWSFSDSNSNCHKLREYLPLMYETLQTSQKMDFCNYISRYILFMIFLLNST